jgi:hypothetical protein
MQVDKVHRSGAGRDGIGDPELNACRPELGLRQDRWMQLRPLALRE